MVLLYIKMHSPLVYTCSPSWTPLPPPSPYHPSGSAQCTSPKLPVSCIEPGLAIHFSYDIIHVLMQDTRCSGGGSEVSPIKNFEIKVSSDLSAEAEMWSDLDLRLYPKTVGPPSLCDLVLVSGQWRCYIDICKPVERNNSEAGKQSIIGHLFKI